nr:exosome complex component RRP4 homolog [Coffea arabica]
MLRCSKRNCFGSRGALGVNQCFCYLHVQLLHRGQLLRIPSYLVKRRKQHFHHLDLYGVDLILGCNGFIWVGEHVEAKDDMVADQMIKSEQENANLSGSASSDDQEQSHTSLEIRQHLCRIANAVRVLSTLRFMVTAELITN